MNIHFFTSGIAPMPPVKGGGVENLIQLLIDENEYYNKCKFYIYSLHDANAAQEAEGYKKSEFIYVKVPKIVKTTDRFVWNIFHDILHKEKIFLKNVFQRIYFIIKTREFIQRIVKSEKSDIIMIEHSALLLFSLVGVNKRNCRIYFHSHNICEHNYKSLSKVTKKMDGVIAVSNSLRISYPAFLQQCPNQYVLKNCIDTKKFNDVGNFNIQTQEKYQKKYNKDCKKVVLFIGRITDEKGVLEVIKAFKILKRNDIKLLIAGGVFYSRNIHTVFEQKVLEEAENQDIQFLGYVDYADVPYLYRMADLVVVPSKCLEAAGLVVIEGMACGAAVITTRSGGIPEYAMEAVRYVSVNEHMDEQIASQINSYFYQTENEQRKEKEYAKSVAAQYSEKNYFENFVSILSIGRLV